jgi:DNA-binding NarL/FixJ family response regulator
MEQIQLLIVEDDQDWLRGLTAYLSNQPDIHVVGNASTSEDALAQIAELDLDVVLMDIMLANSVEGIWLTSKVTAASAARVVMLTSMEDKELIFEAFQAGAVDYHIKSNFKEIPDAIRAAYRNRSPINPAVAERMREEFRRLKQLERDVRVKEMKDLITPAELEVLKLIDQGYTQPQIAEKFVISLRTVKNHVNHILRKLNVGSSREAAEKARSSGMLEEE